MVIKLCERDLVPGIGRIYEALDQRLVQSGVMPEMPATRSPARPPRAHGARAGAGAMAEEDEASAPAWAARFTHRMAGMKGGMQASMGQNNFGDGPAEYAGGAQGVLLEALHHLLQESRGNRESPRTFALFLRRQSPAVATRNALGAFPAAEHAQRHAARRHRRYRRIAGPAPEERSAQRRHPTGRGPLDRASGAGG